MSQGKTPDAVALVPQHLTCIRATPGAQHGAPWPQSSGPGRPGDLRETTSSRQESRPRIPLPIQAPVRAQARTLPAPAIILASRFHAYAARGTSQPSWCQRSHHMEGKVLSLLL